jgi:hypothetical protein
MSRWRRLIEMIFRRNGSFSSRCVVVMLREGGDDGEGRAWRGRTWIVSAVSASHAQLKTNAKAKQRKIGRSALIIPVDGSQAVTAVRTARRGGFKETVRISV